MTEILRTPPFSPSVHTPGTDAPRTEAVETRAPLTRINEIYNRSGVVIRVDAPAPVPVRTSPDLRGNPIGLAVLPLLRSTPVTERTLQALTEIVLERHGLPEKQPGLDYAVDDFPKLPVDSAPASLESARQHLFDAREAVKGSALNDLHKSALDNHLADLQDVVENAIDCWETAFWMEEDPTIKKEAVTRLGWNPSLPRDADEPAGGEGAAVLERRVLEPA